MQKRHIIIGAVMLVASVASCSLIRMTATSPAIEVAGMASPAFRIATSPPLVASLPEAEWSDELSEQLGALSDTSVLIATGVALLGMASGLRRHAS